MELKTACKEELTQLCSSWHAAFFASSDFLPRPWSVWRPYAPSLGSHAGFLQAIDSVFSTHAICICRHRRLSSTISSSPTSIKVSEIGYTSLSSPTSVSTTSQDIDYPCLSSSTSILLTSRIDQCFIIDAVIRDQMSSPATRMALNYSPLNGGM